MVRLGVLGTTEVFNGGHRVQLTQQDLRVLTALVLVAADGEADSEHVEALAWVEQPSPRALQSAVYRLRKLLGDDAIITRRRRIALNPERCHTDLDEFVERIGAQPTASLPTRAQLGAALGLVRGAPFDTMAGHPAWNEPRGRWADRVDDVIDMLVQRVLADGDGVAAIPLAREHLAHLPSSARRWLRLVDVLVAAGRRADALRTIEGARAALARAGAGDSTAVLDLLDRERAILSGAVVGLPPNDVAEHPAPIGRDAEYCQVQRALERPDSGAIVLYGPEGVGKTTLMNAVAASWQGRGGRVIRVAGDERLHSTFDELAERLATAFPRIADLPGDAFSLHERLRSEGTTLIEPTLVCIDDAQWTEGDALGRLATLWRGAAPAVRVLLCLRPGSPTVEHVGATVPFHLVEVPPLSAEATVAVLHAAGANDLDLAAAALVHSATQGIPALILTYLQLRRRSSSPQFSLAAVVEQRFSALPADAQRLVQLVGVAGGAVAEAHLPELLEMGRVAVRQAAVVAIESGLVTLAHGSVRLAENLAPFVSGLVSPSDAAALARRLLMVPVDRHDPAALMAAARLHVLADPQSGWRAAVDGYVEALDVVNSFDTTRRFAIADAALRDLHEVGAPRVALAPLFLRLGLAAHMSGDVVAGRDAVETAYCVALESGDAATTVDVVAHSSDATMVAVTDIGDDARALVSLWRDNPAVGTHARIRLDAVAALHEMARYDSEFGAQRARAAVADARATGDPALLAEVLGTVVVDEIACRALDDEAAELMTVSRVNGRVGDLVRSALYHLCARMRAQQATFDDPVLAELAMLAERHPSTNLHLRHRLVTLVRHLVQGRRDAVLEGLSVLRGGLPSHLPPLLERTVLTLEALAEAPDWWAFDPARLVGDPADLHLSAPTDVALWRAASSLRDGNVRSAEHTLRQLGRPVTTGRTSPVATTRLPLLTVLVARLGSTELAAQHLEMNLSLRGCDLSMLPTIHLGPTDLWLARLADVAGDSALAASLHDTASARLSALDGRPPTRVVERGV